MLGGYFSTFLGYIHQPIFQCWLYNIYPSNSQHILCWNSLLNGIPDFVSSMAFSATTMDWWQREKTWKNSNFLTRKYHHKLVDSIPWMIPFLCHWIAMAAKKKSDDTRYGNDIYGFYPLVRNVTIIFSAKIIEAEDFPRLITRYYQMLNPIESPLNTLNPFKPH